MTHALRDLSRNHTADAGVPDPRGARVGVSAAFRDLPRVWTVAAPTTLDRGPATARPHHDERFDTVATLPQASGGFGDKPVLTFPDTEAPAELEVQVLVQGTGDTIEAGDNIVVNYLGQTWGGHVFDNSYDRGSAIDFPIGIGRVIGGWDQGLVGKQIGSRVLLSIPPHHGYGSRGVPQAGIGGDDVLVFVVDILGTN